MRKIILLLILTQFAAIPAALAQTLLTPELRRLPVFISIPIPGTTNACTGTGVYLTQSNKIFLVTAKHVLFSAPTFASFVNTNVLLYSMGLESEDARCAFKINLHTLNEGGFLKPHSQRDLAVVCLGHLKDGTNLMFNKGVISTVLTNTPLAWSTADNCQYHTNVLEGNDALILGFPTELLNILAEDVDFTKPLIRKGIISQKNSVAGKYIIDSGVFGGNSGGPLITIERTYTADRVFALQDRFRVAGIIVKFVPAATRIWATAGITNQMLVYSGYSVAEPIDAAVELMGQFH